MHHKRKRKLPKHKCALCMSQKLVHGRLSEKEKKLRKAAEKEMLAPIPKMSYSEHSELGDHRICQFLVRVLKELSPRDRALSFCLKVW